MTTDIDAKLASLKTIIKKHHSAVIAFSGGVDSTFLACVAKEVLGTRLLLVTATSSTYPSSELHDARSLASSLGIEQRIIESEETDIPGFSENPPDRCYYCKRELFSLMKGIAAGEGYEAVFDGSNTDDLADYRPGRRAVSELEIISPLREAGLTKSDIRLLSQRYGLPTASKPARACLASRFPYGETITRDKLSRVDRAEAAVSALGFAQYRVRSHGDLARIELGRDEMDRGWALRHELRAACKEAGFVFAALDLEGYRTGAMNEALGPAKSDWF